jgi:hypothetical protein
MTPSNWRSAPTGTLRTPHRWQSTSNRRRLQPWRRWTQREVRWIGRACGNGHCRTCSDCSHRPPRCYDATGVLMKDRPNPPRWNTIARPKYLRLSVTVECHLAGLADPDPALSICVQNPIVRLEFQCVCDSCERAIGWTEKTLIEVEQPDAALLIPRTSFRITPPGNGCLEPITLINCPC